MARICTTCGRPLDPEHHDLLRYPEGHKREGEVVRRVVLRSRGRGRLGITRERVYGCRVRLVAHSPTTGKRLVPSSPQRAKASGLAAYVHEDRLREEH